ncbi:MAG TPA: hypothetical protein GX011_05550 [Clostridiales bacterium]|nr:hypothetical protein [Clostridiales bacterium]
MNGSNDTVWVLIISVFSACLAFLLALIVLNIFLRKRLLVEKRLLHLQILSKENTAVRKPSRVKAKKSNRRFDQVLSGELQAAGVLMRAEEFAILWLVLGFVPSGLLALFTGNYILAGTAALLGIAGPPLYVRKQKKKRVVAFENQLGDALVTMCNCLRSGLTLTQAFENIAADMGEPISKEFARLLNEVKYGSTMEKALVSLAERVGSNDLELTVTAINIQRQAGGNLSEILTSISETIKARVKLKSDIRVATATGRVSGIVIGCLPIGLGLIIFLVNPDYIISFVQSGIGRVLLAVGAVMEVLGFMMIRKILDIKY